MNIIESRDFWLDDNGMIKPRMAWRDSGNGPTYSVLDIAMSDEAGEAIGHLAGWFRRIAEDCELESDGLMYRTRARGYGQEQWDNLLAWIVGCIIFGHHDLAKRIFWYGVRHCGFYDTDGKLEWKDWLWRFFHVWPLLWVACWPRLAPIVRPILWLMSLFLSVDPRNPGGNHLNYLWMYGCKKAGLTLVKFDQVKALLPLSTRKYFERVHRFVGLADRIAGADW
jgi:hypothetical protein